MNDIIIAGAGIGGLTLALRLHAAGIACRVYEASPAIEPLGVGINVLPHAARVLHDLGLGPALDAVGVRTGESVFYNRFGQLVHAEPAGLAAGYAWPQYSVHRGDLQSVLAAAVRERLGADAIVCGHRCVDVRESGGAVTVRFARTDGADAEVTGAAVVGCDGVHSAVRAWLHPGEGPPVYSGYNMWRGMAEWPRFLSGASMVRAGWLATGKLVAYPIRELGGGRQLVNWVAEIETPRHLDRGWNRTGRLADFLPAFADWHFPWLDVPALLEASGTVLEYPMVDQEPLPWWGRGRVTLLGDAAHPMVPRGSNGAGQAILDTVALASALGSYADPASAFAAYEAERRPATAKVVRMNRTNPPDAVLREVYERTGDRPFDHISDVISEAELTAVTGAYKRVAGYSREALGG